MTIPARRVLAHIVVWLAVYAFWLVVTRDRQPTWAVAVIATLILVAASAAGVYCDWYVLRPWFAAHGRWVEYGAGVIGVIGVLTVPTVVLIQAVYDGMEIPREGRFGFWMNVAMESAWYAVHIAAGAGIRTVIRLRGNAPPGPVAPAPGERITCR